MNMYSKLTLRMPKTVIEKAKMIAKEKGTSISQMMTDFFNEMPGEESSHLERMMLEVSPETRSFLETIRLSEGAKVHGLLTKEDRQEAYASYLDKKYGL